MARNNVVVPRTTNGELIIEMGSLPKSFEEIEKMTSNKQGNRTMTYDKQTIDVTAEDGTQYQLFVSGTATILHGTIYNAGREKELNALDNAKKAVAEAEAAEKKATEARTKLADARRVIEQVRLAQEAVAQA